MNENFQSLSFSEESVIKTKIPGPKSIKLVRQQRELEGKAISYPVSVPIALDCGSGATIKDLDGNILLDFFGGAGVLNVGHNNPFVVKAADEQSDKLVHGLDFPTEVRIHLMRNLSMILKDNFRHGVKIQFGGPTGSDAIEMAIKLAKINTKRVPIVAFEGSYHGMSAGALSITSEVNVKENFLPLLPEIHFIPYSYCYRCPFNKSENECSLECASYFEHKLKDPHSGVSRPSSVFMEPIQGEGGTIVPKKEFVTEIQRICEDNHVILVFDEIQAGFCRTGKFFSFQHFTDHAQVITLSKAIGGIGYPLAGIAYDTQLDTWTKGMHIGTFRGNQVAMAAGSAAIEFMIENNLDEYANKMGVFMRSMLNQLKEKNESIGDIRGEGLMVAVEIVKPNTKKIPDIDGTAKIRLECLKRGLLVEVGGHFYNVIRFLPPLIVTKTQIIAPLESLMSFHK
jgi:diaminobutyrate-2-oxoglutarate transaminase